MPLVDGGADGSTATIMPVARTAWHPSAQPPL